MSGNSSGARKLTSELRVAYHEAGHAVAASYQSGVAEVKQVTIVPDGETLGMVSHFKDSSFKPDVSMTPVDRATLEDWIIEIYAGMIAEEKASGEPNHENWQDDLEKAIQLASHAVGSVRQAEAYLEWLRITAEDFVAFHWEEIEAVAKALLEHKTLSWDDVEKIIEVTPSSNSTVC